MVPRSPGVTTHTDTIPQDENAKQPPIIRRVPTFRLPQRIQESIDRGIQLLRYEISARFVRVTVIANDETGYMLQLERHDFTTGTAVTVIRSINAGGVAENTNGPVEEVFMDPSIAYVLGYPIESLPDDCPIDRLIVHMLRPENAQLIYVMDMLTWHCSHVFEEKFRQREGRPLMRVNRFCVEFEGLFLSEETLFRPFFDHMQANEVHFQAPRDQEHTRRLKLVPTWTSPGFTTARKLTIEDGFYINLKWNTWMMFDEIRVTLNSLTSTHLRTMLTEWRARDTFVSSRVRVLKSNWNSARLKSFFDEFPDDRVTITGPIFIYEDGLHVELHGIDIIFVAVDADQPFAD